MAYIKKEEVKEIRETLKKEFPKYKISVTRSDYSSVNIAIMKGEIDFGSTHTSVNEYHIDKHYEDNKEAKDMLNRVHEIAKSQGWYNNSDSMTDYFDYAYYINIAIGKWDQPYICTGETKKAA